LIHAPIISIPVSRAIGQRDADNRMLLVTFGEWNREVREKMDAARIAVRMREFAAALTAEKTHESAVDFCISSNSTRPAIYPNAQRGGDQNRCTMPIIAPRVSAPGATARPV
jgi:hypothetical protein